VRRSFVGRYRRDAKRRAGVYGRYWESKIEATEHPDHSATSSDAVLAPKNVDTSTCTNY
jgi:hypothetical protein